MSTSQRETLIAELETLQAFVHNIECDCIDPPDEDHWQDYDAHSQYCRVYLHGYIGSRLAVLASGGAHPQEHKHDYANYDVCRICGKTEAAIEGCHHCGDSMSVQNQRCWWCLRDLSGGSPTPPAQEKEQEKAAREAGSTADASPTGSTASSAGGSQWHPIATAPRDERVFFWVVPLTAREAHTDTSGNPITVACKPYRHEGRYGSWSSLMKAVLWMPLPTPPVAKVSAAPLPDVPSVESRVETQSEQLSPSGDPRVDTRETAHEKS